MIKKIDDLPDAARGLITRVMLDVRADNQELDSDFLARFADAACPENLELLKQYCVERFDHNAQALLFTSVPTDTSSINPLYEKYLEKLERMTFEFLASVLADFPQGMKDDVLSWVKLKLNSRKLHWLAHATRQRQPLPASKIGKVDPSRADAPVHFAPRGQSTRKGKTARRNAQMEGIKRQIRAMRNARLSHLEICERLKDAPRPANAAWRDFSWLAAYRNQKYKGAVKSWISRI